MTHNHNFQCCIIGFSHATAEYVLTGQSNRNWVVKKVGTFKPSCHEQHSPVCRMVNLQFSSNSPTFPGISHIYYTFIIYLLNHHGYTVLQAGLCVYSCGSTCSPFCACHLKYHLKYSSYVDFVTIITAVAHHRQTTISRTFPNFPDFSLINVKFSRCVWSSS